MQSLNYGGIVGALIELINAGEGTISPIQRIELTAAEMEQVKKSGAFRTSVAKFYGESDAPVIKEITSSTDGSIISFFLMGVLVSLKTEDPVPPIPGLTYPALVPNAKGTSMFTTEDGYMLIGTGNPANDFVYGKNANIELGIAIRKANDPTYYGNPSGEFNIQLIGNEAWTFAVTAGSLQENVKITDMYDVVLQLGTESDDPSKYMTWRLEYRETVFGQKANNYVWYHNTMPAVQDGAIDAQKQVTQMIEQYGFPFIKPYLSKSVQFTKANAALGNFVLKLVATPKFNPAGEVCTVQATAKITYKEPTPTPKKTFIIGGNGMLVESGGRLVDAGLTADVNDVAYGAQKYIAAGAQIYISDNKETWTELTGAPFADPVSRVIFSTDKFYFSVDNDGIYSYDPVAQVWDIEHAEPIVYNHAEDVNGIPVFGTKDGRIIAGPDWEAIQVAPEGDVSVSYDSGIIYAMVKTDTEFQVYSGHVLNNLIPSAPSELDTAFVINSTHYDAKNKMIVVAARATEDNSPVFVIGRQGHWTFIVSDLDEYAIDVADGAALTSHTLYTTADFRNFVAAYSFDPGFAPKAIIYA